jgi:hypothetical protein
MEFIVLIMEVLTITFPMMLICWGWNGITTSYIDKKHDLLLDSITALEKQNLLLSDRLFRLENKGRDE